MNLLNLFGKKTFPRGIHPEGFKEETHDHQANLFENAFVQEEEWCDYLFGNGSMIGLNSELLKEYVRWIGAKRIKSLVIMYHSQRTYAIHFRGLKNG